MVLPPNYEGRWRVKTELIVNDNGKQIKDCIMAFVEVILQ
jgi:hypothetical protein